jgi:hypothetical protein
MARLEDVLPALREGKKIRRQGFRKGGFLVLKGKEVVDDAGHGGFSVGTCYLLADDWEVVPSPVKVADYLVEQKGLFVGSQSSVIVKPVWQKETHPIGQQPEGSVLVPGSERSLEE